MFRPLALLLMLSMPVAAQAQGWIEPFPGRPGAPSVVRIRTDVRATVTGRIAQVEVEEWFRNDGGAVGEGDYLYPLPGEAVFSNFSLFQGDEELRGETMEAGEARRIYEEIVRRRRDPALIELAGHGLIRARVFPIGPGEVRRITLRYTQLLERAGGALQLRYAAGVAREGVSGGPIVRPHPRPPVLDARHQPVDRRANVDDARPGAVSFTLVVEDGDRFRDPFSPTHPLRVERREGRIRATPSGPLTGDLSLFLPLAGREVGMTLATHRPAGEDGYFMLTLSPGEARAARAVSRDLTAVVDVSGSMSGEKLVQAQEALRQLLGTLHPRDRFRLIAFGSDVRTQEESWTPATSEALARARRWVDGLVAEGGTNIQGALAEAFRLEPRAEALPVVLFLTDGLPSVGEQDPERLAALAGSGGGRARVFSFGIGFDVNTHLLERMSEAGRGAAEFVIPGESVETAVGQVALRIQHPMLTDLRIARQPVRLRQLVPGRLPDLFAGEDLVIFGRYVADRGTAEGPLEVVGSREGRQERFSMAAAFPSHREADGYVARLWAARRLGELDRTIRLEGASPELVEEARQLALRHGLVSRYSSYLVLEPGMGPVTGVSPEVRRHAAVGAPPPAAPAPLAVTGMGAVVAADRAARQRAVASQAELEALSPTSAPGTVADERRIDGRSFHLRDGTWVDASHRAGVRVVRVRPFSAAYFDLLRALPELRAVWSQLEGGIVAGATVSLELVEDGSDALPAAEIADITNSFRGRRGGE